MDCAECEAYEFALAHPVRAWLRANLPHRRPHPLTVMGAGFSSVMKAAAGVREPTHYERHQLAWIVTGDYRELERMTRQVEC